MTVMGLGLFGGGLGAAEFALRQGAHVTVTDLRGRATLAESLDSLAQLPGQDRLRVVLGRHDEADFVDADVVIPNPAVPAKAPMLVAARAAGTEVTSAIELLLRRLSCRVIAVTGTQGKSSTVHFTTGLLRAALPSSCRVVAGGNIGGSLLSRAESFAATDVVILELSSYQLEHISEETLRGEAATVDVAAITNVGVDHIARHGTVEAYHRAKLRIASLVRKGGLLVLPVGLDAEAAPNAAPQDVRTLRHGDGGEIEVDGSGWITVGGERAVDASLLAAPGAFQRLNLAVAVAAALELGAGAEALGAALPALTGLPHRIEPVGPMRSVAGEAFELIDNGISTTTDSTVAALESLSSPTAPGPLRKIVGVGGQAKQGARFDELAEAACRLGWAIVPFGQAAAEIAAAAQAGQAELCGLTRDIWPLEASAAAELAIESLASGPATESPGMVLFSPACASFDHYPNFRARALAFREAVLDLCQPAAGPTEGTAKDSERSQTQD